MTTGATTTTALELQPYIFFYGKCAEAFEFYKQVLGGSYEITLTKDSPMAADFPPEAQERVMHGAFSTEAGVLFLGSDGRETKDIDPDEGNICLALQAKDAEAGDRIFNDLSAGGSVSMPLAEVPWGSRFGMFVDRYGIEWMLSCP